MKLGWFKKKKGATLAGSNNNGSMLVKETVSVEVGAAKQGKMLPILIGLVVIFGITTIVLFVRLKNAPTTASQSDLQATIAQVSKLMILPSDETPTLATVTDAEKLRGQAFFANARNGDRVLLYSKAGKAVLYDPDANKIVDVAPLNVAQQQAAAAQAPVSTPEPTPATKKK
jgi:hypothetical protein